MLTLQHKFDFPGQLSQTVFPDLLLTTTTAGQGDFIPAHRVVLSAVSTKLHSMCKEGGKVVIRNIEYQVLENVVEFIYKGSIQIKDQENVENLRDGLDMLKVNIVIEEVIGGMKEDRVPEQGYNNNLRDHYIHSVDASRATYSVELHGIDGGLSMGASKLEEGKQNKYVEQEIAKKHQDTRPESPDDRDDFKGESFTKVLESMSNHADKHKSLVISNVVSYEATNKFGTDMEVPDEVDDYSDDDKKEETENNDPYVPIKTMKAENDVNPQGLKKVAKSTTKIPCDYCDESVALNYYVNHCKRLHSIRNDDECKRKCFQCGAKVHIIAQKFHDQIYHPVIEKKSNKFVKKSQSLNVVEHNKCLTKVVCDFCNLRVGFNSYRRHVMSKHPEINYKEQVRCGKCGMKVFKSAFKYHRQIFHKSAKVKSTPACDFVPKPTLKINFPKVKVKIEQIEMKVADDELLANAGTTSKHDSNLENNVDKSKDSMEGIISEGDLSE